MIEKIFTFNALRAENLPMPEYMVNPGDIMIRFTGPEDRIVRVSEKVLENVPVKVPEKEKKLLMLLMEAPGYTRERLAEKMGVTVKTIGVYLRTLKEQNIIERVGSDKKVYWKAKTE